MILIDKYVQYMGDANDIVDITGRRYISGASPSDFKKLACAVNSTYEEMVYYSNWYVLDKDMYYFKFDFIFNELLMTELFKEFKLKCPEYILTKNGLNIGIISKNFRKKEAKYLTYNDFHTYHNAQHVSKSLDEFKNFMSTFMRSDNIDILIKALSRLLVADFFSGQADRGSGSISNLLFEEAEDISLAPLSDNGLIFELVNGVLSCFGYIIFPDRFFDNSNTDLEEYSKLRILLNNIEFRTYLIKCLDIDIPEIINRTLEKYKFKLLNSSKEEIISYFDRKKGVIDTTLKLM